MSKIIGIHQPAIAKNHIINGAYDFWQRVEGNTATVSAATSASGYTADRMKYSCTGSSAKSFSVARSTNVPLLFQSGFQSTYSYQYTVGASLASLASGDTVEPHLYPMEGLDYEKLHTKTVTFNFWFMSSVSGTFSFAIKNSAGTRSYVTTFSALGANTWSFQSITVTLDNQGTWNFDNTVGAYIDIGSIAGTTFSTSNLGVWQTGNFVAASTATNYQATNGATINVAQFGCVEGTSYLGFDRRGLTIGNELSICQRYYEKSYDIGTAPGLAAQFNGMLYVTQGGSTGNFLSIFSSYRANKRVSPAVTIYNPTSGATGSGQNFSSSGAVSMVVGANGQTGLMINANNVAITAGQNVGGHFTADADL